MKSKPTRRPSWPARGSACAFRGAQILYTLRTDGGARVLSMMPSHHNHRLGERIGIRLDMDHVIAFEPVQAGHAPGAAAG